jgi:exopolyphosphatase/guanosine-5'-triphosphate,3'-diphosphate pyrophosphatase
MKLAAIDIGSNAIRLQIVRVYEENELVSFKKIEYLRFPLRLGKDVFKKGVISRSTTDKFVKLMTTFKLLIDLYEIENYNAVATSAMREAGNGPEIIDYIEGVIGIEIKIISGTEEARILNKAIIPYLNKGQYVHIDVGGGSTELNLYEDKVLKDSKSVQIGSVRKLNLKKRNLLYKEIKNWVKSTNISSSKNVVGIGTGGNINWLYKLANQANNLTISLAELKALRAYVQAFTYDQRMSVLKMNPDRADVIVPASEIYVKVLQDIGSDHIIVPKVGLKDGLVYELFERVSQKSLAQIEFLENFD